MRTFIQQTTELLHNYPACSGKEFQVVNTLMSALGRLECIINQAEAQFKCGDKHATFNKQTIESLNLPFADFQEYILDEQNRLDIEAKYNHDLFNDKE